MNVYLFQAALLCEPCGIAASAINAPNEDSDHFPQGPYTDGSGESDTPQHCDHCGVFLENPLTPDGAAYVMGEIEQHLTASELWAETAARIEAKHAVLAEWMRHYDYLSHDHDMAWLNSGE